MKQRLIPEERLLIAISDPSKRAGDVFDEIEEFDRIDWARLLDIATFHRVDPVLAAAVLASEIPNIPRWVDFVLSQLVAANAERNLRLVGACNEVVNALAEVDIPALVRKGLPLAAEAYGGIELRRMGDVDLLVRQSDASRVMETLRLAGFSSSASRQEYFLLKLGGLNLPEHERSLGWPSLPLFCVGLSIALFERGTGLGAPVEPMFERVREVECGGTLLPTLDRVDFMIDLCAHFFKDATSLASVEWNWDLLLYKFADVARFARLLNEFELGQLASRLRSHGVGKAVYHAYWHIEKVFPGVMSPMFEEFRPYNTDYLSGFGEGGRIVHYWPDDDVLTRLFDSGRAAAYQGSSNLVVAKAR